MMQLLSILLLSVFHTQVLSVYYGNCTGQYLNGFATKIKTYPDYPYMVRIFEGYKHICGGVLIKLDVVLTAAHCTLNYKDLYIESVCVHQPNGKPRVRMVKKVEQHPGYDITNSTNDIAVVQLKDDFKDPNHVIVNLPDPYQPDQYAFQLAYLLGWGETQKGRLSSDMRILDLQILDQADCTDRVIADKTNICGFGVTLKATGCFGDSGSPYILIGAEPKDDIIIGVQSLVHTKNSTRSPTGVRCDSSYPIIGMNVAFYLDWINQKLAGFGY